MDNSIITGIVVGVRGHDLFISNGEETYFMPRNLIGGPKELKKKEGYIGVKLRFYLRDKVDTKSGYQIADRKSYLNDEQDKPLPEEGEKVDVHIITIQTTNIFVEFQGSEYFVPASAATPVFCSDLTRSELNRVDTYKAKVIKAEDGIRFSLKDAINIEIDDYIKVYDVYKCKISGYSSKKVDGKTKRYAWVELPLIKYTMLCIYADFVDVPEVGNYAVCKVGGIDDKTKQVYGHVLHFMREVK